MEESKFRINKDGKYKLQHNYYPGIIISNVQDIRFPNKSEKSNKNSIAVKSCSIQLSPDWIIEPKFDNERTVVDAYTTGKLDIKAGCYIVLEIDCDNKVLTIREDTDNIAANNTRDVYVKYF